MPTPTAPRPARRTPTRTTGQGSAPKPAKTAARKTPSRTRPKTVTPKTPARTPTTRGRTTSPGSVPAPKASTNPQAPTGPGLVHAPLPRALRDLYATHATALAPIWDPHSGLTVAVRLPASTAVHPARTRCKTCRTNLADQVLLGLYCSYACAGLPAPGSDPETAPRQCKRVARTDEAGEWVFKQRFTTAAAARPYLKPGTTLYRCSHCFQCHIGNSSPAPTVGIPAVTATGHGNLADATVAILRARGHRDPAAATAAETAAAKRDARAVLDALRLPH